jgi:hypothetical protein
MLLRGALTLAAGAASDSYLSAQTPPSRGDSIAGFPDTPIGKLGRTLIEVINSAIARPAPTSCPAMCRRRLSRKTR